MPTWEGAILRQKQANYCKVQGHSEVICANTAEPIEVPFGLWACIGPKHHVLHGSQDFPLEWATLVDAGVHCKLQALPAVNCAKTA